MHFNKVPETNCSKTYNKEAAGLKDVISKNTIKFYKKAPFQICNNWNPEVKHMAQHQEITTSGWNYTCRLWGTSALEPTKWHYINRTVWPHKFYKFVLNQLAGRVASSFTTQNICQQQIIATVSFLFWSSSYLLPDHWSMCLHSLQLLWTALGTKNSNCN